MDGSTWLWSVCGRTRTGTGAIWAIDETGESALAFAGLTMPIDVGFDRHGVMYVLEFNRGPSADMPYAPSSGRLLRFSQDRSSSVVIDGLNYPTAMVFSAAGDLYIATGGAFSEAGQGMIEKVMYPDLGGPAAC